MAVDNLRRKEREGKKKKKKREGNEKKEKIWKTRRDRRLKTINLFFDDCTRCVRISDTRERRRQVTRLATFAPLNVILHLLQIPVSYCGRVSPPSDAIRREEFISDGTLRDAFSSVQKKLSAYVAYSKFLLFFYLSIFT